VVRTGIDPTRFNIQPQPITSKAPSVRLLFFVAAAIAAIGGFVLSAIWIWFSVSALAALIAVALPSRRTLEKAEIARCWMAAEEELTRRIAVFNTAAGDAEPTLESLREILALQERLGLSDAEAEAPRMNTMRGTVHLLEFQAAVAAAGGHFPVVPGDETVTAPDACYFAAATIYDKRGDNDPRGMLYLTNKRALFRAGEGLTTTPWTKVIATSRERYTLSIQRRDRQTPYRFAFDSLGEAMIAEWITANIFAASQVQGGSVEAPGAFRVMKTPAIPQGD
jgi:hypothetical protein